MFGYIICFCPCVIQTQTFSISCHVDALGNVYLLLKGLNEKMRKSGLKGGKEKKLCGQACLNRKDKRKRRRGEESLVAKERGNKFPQMEQQGREKKKRRSLKK